MHFYKKNLKPRLSSLYPRLTVDIATACLFNGQGVDTVTAKSLSTLLCLIFWGILFREVMFVFFVNASYNVSHGGKSMDDDGNAVFVCSGCVVL